MQLKTLHQRHSTAGHYYSLLAGSDSQALMTKLIVPGAKGYLKRYEWNHLEPTKGHYDFTELANDVAFCDAHGLKLVAMILDKTFSMHGQPAQRILPKGMEALEVINSPGGYSALRWDPAVITAMNALTKELGKQFNQLLAFEGVAFVETSISVDPAMTKAHGFTPEKYRDSYLNTLTAAATAMPLSIVHWFMNFFQGNQHYIADIATKMGNRIEMGGPDNLPTSDSLVNGPYTIYPQFAGKTRLFIQMSNPGFAQKHSDGSYYSAAEMIAYAKDKLHVSKIFWMPVGGPAFSLAEAQAQFNTPLAV